jgi:dihydrofolate synthase/folylpolyglutamate synthase
MNFNESIDYLYGLGYELSVKKFGIENTFALLDALENPEKHYLKIQIAGTNGKGSTCAFLESICISAGIKVGKYTSPHLISITERIRIGGNEISEEKFAEYATLVKNVSEKLVAENKLETVPTFFEQVTAIALKFFADEKIEVAILETGIGGRFDATTAAKAEIVGFTPVDLDHQNILGNSLREITSEKAAIIRHNTLVFSVEQKKEAKDVIYEKCRESGVKPILAISYVKVLEDLSAGFLYISFQTKKTKYKTALQIQGKHQWINATLAIYIAESLNDFNFKVSKDDIELGLQNTTHEGRLEFFQGILFDGAHNISGAKALREYLDENINQPITMIFGAMKDKDLTEIAEILFQKADKLILTKPDNPRSLEVSELKNYVSSDFEDKKLFLTETVSEAVKKAKNISTEKDLILVTGSLYLIGEAQKILKNETEI